MKTGSFIGIDFGTTNTSVVSILKDEHGEKINIIGEKGEPFASLFAVYPDNKVNFGNIVKKNRDSLAESCTIISSFKSLLGTDKSITLNNKDFTPVKIVSEYLRCLKIYVKKIYNIDISEASFSFPVDFTPEARRDLRKAAQIAKIKVTGMISESTAAYLATCEKLKGLSRVMVIDWGGGTLDISILEVTEQKVREISVYGEKIGGDDIDKELAERIHSQFNLKLSDPDMRIPFRNMPAPQRDKMLSACERAKIQISEDGEDYPLTIRNYGDYGTKTINVSNEMFEDVVKPIIRNKALKSIDKAMERAGLSKSNIDAVVIAGGSSNLRQFADAVINLFGEDKIILPDNAQFVSAKGAALVPFIGGNFKLNDDIGIVMSDNTVFPILKKDVDGVGSISDTYTFSLVEDSPDAHFIITNGDGRIVYDKVNVPTKGFLNERLEVSAYIDDEQVVNVKIHSSAVADELKDKVAKISQVTYYYDLSEIDS